MPRITKDEASRLYRAQNQAIFNESMPEITELSRQAAFVYELYAQKYWQDPSHKMLLAGYGLVDNVESLLIRVWFAKDRAWSNYIYITFPDGHLTSVPQTRRGHWERRDYYSGGGTEHSIPDLDPIVARLVQIKEAASAADVAAYGFLMGRPTRAQVYDRYPHLNPKGA